MIHINCTYLYIQPHQPPLNIVFFCLSDTHTCKIKTHTHTHACRLFTPTHTLLPPCYSQLVVIPRLSQNSTISLSIPFIPNLMSPCRTCFLQRMWALQTVATARFTRTLAPFLITCKSRWQLEMHFAKSGSHSYQSAAYALKKPFPCLPVESLFTPLSITTMTRSCVCELLHLLSLRLYASKRLYACYNSMSANLHLVIKGIAKLKDSDNTPTQREHRGTIMWTYRMF